MAKGGRVVKKTWKRNKPAIQPESNKPFDPLLGRCKEFLNVNSTIALDDSFDRDFLAGEMVEFIMTLMNTDDENLAAMLGLKDSRDV